MSPWYQILLAAGNIQEGDRHGKLLSTSFKVERLPEHRGNRKLRGNRGGHWGRSPHSDHIPKGHFIEIVLSRKKEEPKKNTAEPAGLILHYNSVDTDASPPYQTVSLVLLMVVLIPWLIDSGATHSYVSKVE
uniref:Uncharacterized protein n=1 Tax=Cannabis sativa TaxID=3483 RepID=A0A803P9Q4_CANSA